MATSIARVGYCENTDCEDYAKGVVESHYWLLLAENGWPGYLTYMLFIVFGQCALIVGWWRHRAGARGAYLLGLAVALTLLYAHSNLERVLTQTKNLAAYFVLLGAALRLARSRAPGDEANTGA